MTHGNCAVWCVVCGKTKRGRLHADAGSCGVGLQNGPSESARAPLPSRPTDRPRAPGDSSAQEYCSTPFRTSPRSSRTANVRPSNARPVRRATARLHPEGCCSYRFGRGDRAGALRLSRWHVSTLHFPGGQPRSGRLDPWALRPRGAFIGAATLNLFLLSTRST